MSHYVHKAFYSSCVLAAFVLPTHKALAETPSAKRFAVLVGTSLTNGGWEENHDDLELAYQTLTSVIG